MPLSPLGSIDLANLWLNAGAGEADRRGEWERLLVQEPALALWAALAAAASPLSGSATTEEDASSAASLAPVRAAVFPAFSVFPASPARPVANSPGPDSRGSNSRVADSHSAEGSELDRVALAAIAARCLLPAFQAVAARPAAVERAAATKGTSDSVVDLTDGVAPEVAPKVPPDAAPVVAANAASDTSFEAAFDPTAWADGLWAIRAARRGLRADLAGLVGEAWTAEWLGDAGEWLERAQTSDDLIDAADSIVPAHRRRPSIKDAAGGCLERLAALRRKRRLGSLPDLPAETKAAITARWSTASGPAVDLLALAKRLGDASEQARRFRRELDQEKLVALRDLAYGASHEINNPLANIATRAQGLMRDERDPERRRSLAVIASQAMRAYTMIADMMLFAKPPVPRCSAVELAELPQRIVEELRARADEQHTDLVVMPNFGSSGARAESREWTGGLRRSVPGELPEEPRETLTGEQPDDPPGASTGEQLGKLSDDLSEVPTSVAVVAWADRDQLLVALRALVENALEALGEGGRVEIGLLPATVGSCGFQVTDTGPGVPMEVRSRLFDPYYSGREAGRGLGLGLCKAWRIATDHGGRVMLDEQFSPGARFVLELPRHG